MQEVIVPTDLSRQSRMLLDSMNEFARFGLKKVTLLYVEMPGAPQNDFMRRSLQSSVSKLLADGYEAELRVVQGRNPADEILKASAQSSADTIILPSSGKGKATRLLVGSNSLDVMRRAETKVFLKRFLKGPGGGISEACTLTFKRILVALPPKEHDKGFMEKVNDLLGKGSLDNILLLNPASGKSMEYGHDRLQATEAVHDALGTEGYALSNIPKGILETMRSDAFCLLVLPGCLREPLRGVLRGSPMGQIVHDSKASILIIPNQ